MDTIAEIFKAKDCWCEVNSAWAFSMEEVFLYLDMASEDADKKASLLLQVDLRQDTPVVTVLQSIDFGALDYFASSPDDHWLLVSGGFIHHIHGEEERFYDPISELFLRGVVPAGDGKLILFGEDGTACSFEDGDVQRWTSPLDDEMLDAHFRSNSDGYICGTSGAVLHWNGQLLEQVDLTCHDEFEAVYAKDDQTLLLGINDGTGIVYANDEIVRLGKADGGIQAITVFQGVEYWGDDDFGIYTRKGDKLVEKFETEGAYRLNATKDVLCAVVGAEVYMFDGSAWIQLHIEPKITKMVSRVPLDFVPL